MKKIIFEKLEVEELEENISLNGMEILPFRNEANPEQCMPKPLFCH